MKAVKDFQRQAVYKAEDECSFWLQGKYFSEKEADELVTRISEWAEIRKPDCQFNAVDKDGDIFPVAKGMANSIVLPIFAMNESYICHEMAHVINYQDETMADHHGINFSGIYLNIVKEFIGLDAYKELKNSFDTLGVRYNLN